MAEFVLCYKNIIYNHLNARESMHRVLRYHQKTVQNWTSKPNQEILTYFGRYPRPRCIFFHLGRWNSKKIEKWDTLVGAPHTFFQKNLLNLFLICIFKKSDKFMQLIHIYFRAFLTTKKPLYPFSKVKKD